MGRGFSIMVKSVDPPYLPDMKTILPALFGLAILVPLSAQAASHPRNDPASVLNRILAVLQADPDSASDSCVEALKELHKTQKIVADMDTDNANQNAAVARDVLESDFDETIEVCGTDARTLCRTKAETLPKLPALCLAIRHRPVADDAD
ncbi:hypothetical protein [Swaminathania salitolerans]|uniref:Uncharacterized protein n=1 Tax=Swaminathania salitolerans TaxID=182838 RepID=A0A511BRD3_9PROT|nr:hypothetical protein [Swaminathania salitolerans]GBQ12340.1 hypothetical protein AA21291_1156 [Swaminathania salitolerans LMG 21291]GEL02815.1 hypothetical protein SSA02_19780 [Swaminathania salitolerans]